MAIAQEMKQRQREADEAKKSAATIVYKNRNQQYSDSDLECFRKKLLAARVEFADHVIDVDGQSIEAAAQELAKTARGD